VSTTTPYLSREIAAAARWLAAHARERAAGLPIRIPDQDFADLEFRTADYMAACTKDLDGRDVPRYTLGNLLLTGWAAAVISEDMARCLDDVAYVALSPGRVAARLKSGGKPIAILEEGGATDAG
jgi:hypothetical protein